LPLPHTSLALPSPLPHLSLIPPSPLPPQDFKILFFKKGKKRQKRVGKKIGFEKDIEVFQVSITEHFGLTKPKGPLCFSTTPPPPLPHPSPHTRFKKKG
jgi:hypothetical protein